MEEETTMLVRRIASVSASTLGPRSSQHVMLKSMDSVCVTSSAKYYIEQTCTLNAHNPVMKIFLQILSTHHKTHGDSGWLCIYVATHLLLASQHCDIPPCTFIQGINHACSVAIEELTSSTSPLALTLDWGEPEQVVCMLKSIFRPHQSTTHLTDDQSTQLATTLLSAFIGSLREGSGATLSPHVIFHATCLTLTLPHGSCCQHLEGTVLLDIPFPRAFPKEEARDRLVAVFEESLELPSQLAHLSIESTHHPTAPGASPAAPVTNSVKELEYSYLEQMCDILLHANVGLVCCQRRIHPHLQRLLSLRGIVCIPRLSIRYVNVVLRLSGAKQLGAFPQLQTLNHQELAGRGDSSPLNRASLGFLHRVYMRSIGGKKLIALQQRRLDDANDEEGYAGTDSCFSEGVSEDEVVRRLLVDESGRKAQNVLDRRLKLSTLVLVGYDENQCREVETCCVGALKVLTQLVNSSTASVLPGGGCWQAYVAHTVRERIQQVEPDNSQSLCLSDNDELDDSDEDYEWCSKISTAHLRHSRKASLLFCDILERVAGLIGDENHYCRAYEWEPSLRRSTIWDGAAIDHVGSFQWPVRVASAENTLESISISSEGRFVNPLGCEILTESVPGSSDGCRVLRASALDAMVPCVSALQVAVEAVTSIIDIDGVIR